MHLMDSHSQTNAITHKVFLLLPLLLPPQDGCTALHWAADRGHLPVLQALLRDPRIDPREKDNVRMQGKG